MRAQESEQEQEKGHYVAVRTSRAECSKILGGVGSTRDETRTRKALRPGDFESPASTDSATRACQQFSSESGVVLPDALSFGWRPAHSAPTTTRILPGELVRPAPKLGLKRE